MSLGGIKWLDSLPKWDGTNFSPLDVPRVILAALGNPQDSFKSIHIAGTNGKGSVATYLEKILLNNYPRTKIARTCSPYLESISEAAILGGQELALEILDYNLLKVKSASRQTQMEPTAYVALLIAIFLSFKEQGVELAIVEAGLGGLEDATNLLNNKVLQIITNISLDHQEQLGGSLESIAYHKAGIITSSCPTVLGEIDRSLFSIFYTQASLVGSKVYELEFTNNGCYGELLLGGKLFKIALPKCEPNYKILNLALSILSSYVFGLSYLDVDRLVDNLSYSIPTLRGRFEKFRSHDGYKIAIIDIAHNEEGVRQLFSPNLLEYYNSFYRVDLVVCFLKRKNWSSCLEEIIKEISNIRSFNKLYILDLGDEFIGLKEIEAKLYNINVNLITNLDDILFNQRGLKLFFGTTKMYSTFVNWSLSRQLSREI